MKLVRDVRGPFSKRNMGLWHNDMTRATQPVPRQSTTTHATVACNENEPPTRAPARCNHFRQTERTDASFFAPPPLMKSASIVDVYVRATSGTVQIQRQPRRWPHGVLRHTRCQPVTHKLHSRTNVTVLWLRGPVNCTNTPVKAVRRRTAARPLCKR